MQLEDYFEFETFETKFGPVERIRIKGYRLAIEHIVDCFRNGISPETIVREIYPNIDLEKVYATITYYLHNREKVDSYIRRCEEIGEQYYQEHKQQPEPDVVKRLKALKAAKGLKEAAEGPTPLSGLGPATAPLVAEPVST
jgi:uncharacterized protein (DUF433 family)